MSKYKVVKHLCPKCGYNKAKLIDSCILYDQYYICENHKCGYCDFSASKHLSQQENDEREKAIEKSLKEVYIPEDELKTPERVDFT